MQFKGGSGQGTFASLAYPEYRRLWISGLIVFMAVNAQGIARGWLAKEITGTNAGLGGVLLGFGLAMLIATPIGGVLADRMPKRRLIFIAHVLLAVSSVWIGLAIVFDVVAYWMLIASGAVQAVAFALYGPARMAFIAELVEGETMNNAIVLGQMSAESMRIVGPTTAGMAIGVATWGLQAVFLVCAALCAVATVIGLFLPPGNPDANRPSRTPLAEMRDGLAYVRGREDLRLLMACALGVVMLAYPYLAFLPTLADDIFHRGSSGYGILSACSAVGAVTAGLFTAGRGGRLEPWRLATIAGVGFGVGLLALAAAPTFAVAMIVLAAVGGSSLAFETTTQSLLLNLSDFEYHGRIQSLVMLGYSGFGIVALPLGLAADAFGLRPTLAGMGIAVLAIVAVFASRRQQILDRELLLDLG
ncbi:MAG: putative arabinose efflux permease, family [Acidimicrobiales bacterium]|nr:putative arabinose efflux permease, family [Acidimicrobiales bacterium]